jgi:hypothetical protein
MKRGAQSNFRIRFWGSPIFWQFIGPLILIGNLLRRGEVIFWGTTYLQFTPWHLLAWKMIQSGTLPLWNAFNGLGTPLLANYQSGLLYPPNLFLFIGAWISQAQGIAVTQTLLVCIHLILSGIGFVKLLESLNVKPFGQTIGGIAYAFCGYQIARASFLSMNAALAWTPWILYAAYQWIDALKYQQKYMAYKFAVLQVLFTTLQLLSGHAQISWYTQIMAAGWVLAWIVTNRKSLPVLRCLFIFGGIVLFSLGLAMAQLAPTAEYLLQSQRASEVGIDYGLNYSFWPWRFLSLISPNLFGNPGMGNYWVTADNYWEDAIYIGLLPVICGVIFLGRLVFKRKSLDEIHRTTGWFGFGLIITGILLALGKYTPIYSFLYRNIPTFNLFQAPSRWCLFIEIGLVLLAAIEVDRWVKPAGRIRYWSNLGMMAAAAAAGTALFAMVKLSNSIQHTYLQGCLETAILLVFIAFFNLILPEEKRKKKIWQIGVISLVLADLLYTGWSLNPGVSIKLFDENHKKLASVANNATVYMSADDEERVKFKKFLRFDTFQPTGGFETLPNFFIPNSNLYEGIKSLNNFDPLTPARYPAFMKMIEEMNSTSKEYFLRWLGVDTIEIISDIQKGRPEWKQLTAKPSFQIVPCVLVRNEGNSLELTSELISSGTLDQEAVLEDIPLSSTSCQAFDIVKKADIIYEKPQQQKYRVDISWDGWFIQKQTWYPGWKAFVDGKSVEIKHADYYLRGVYISAGEHTLEFKYQPASFMIGGLVSLIFIILLVVLLIYIPYRIFLG